MDEELIFLSQGLILWLKSTFGWVLLATEKVQAIFFKQSFHWRHEVNFFLQKSQFQRIFKSIRMSRIETNLKRKWVRLVGPVGPDDLNKNSPNLKKNYSIMEQNTVITK